MGVGRLLAKAWIALCLFSGAHALHQQAGANPNAVFAIVVAVLLFTAMGLLFATGYGVSARDGAMPLLARLKPQHALPDFNGIVFVVFALLSYLNQVLFAPTHPIGPVISAVSSAMQFVVPGQSGLLAALAPCAPDSGRVFASSFAWVLAIVYVASAVSRIRLSAGLLRLERSTRPEMLGATTHAGVLGIAAIAGIQLFFFGSAWPWIACGTLAGLPGAVLIGLMPLMLAYLIVAALTAGVALSPEKHGF
ncbi:MAG TPA: hypothetical protein VL026_02300 [Rhizomicrobium sp.]|nr:hypothetical protein [Rhizomicrobium sp.]